MRVRLFVFLAVFVSAPFSAFPASVGWNFLERIGSGLGSDGVYRAVFGTADSFSLGICPNIMIEVETDPDFEEVTVRGSLLYMLLTGGDSWVLMEEGDLADASTTRNLDSYFLHGWIDGVNGVYDIRADDSITAFEDDTFRFYLGLATAHDYWPPGSEYPAWDYVYYGWALFEYSNGTVDVVSSALNTEGGGIYVGTGRTTAVPEPHAAALAFLGAGILAFGIRRRKADGFMNPESRRNPEAGK